MRELPRKLLTRISHGFEIDLLQERARNQTGVLRKGVSARRKVSGPSRVDTLREIAASTDKAMRGRRNIMASCGMPGRRFLDEVRAR